jgi:hypothetical protein
MNTIERESFNAESAAFFRRALIVTYLAALIVGAVRSDLVSQYGFLLLPLVGIFCAGLAKSIGKNPWLYGIGGLIPIVNLLVVVVLFFKSGNVFKSHGLKPTFWGGARELRKA